MKRRTLMAWGVSAAATASLGTSTGTSIGASDVRRLTQATAQLYGLGQRHGGSVLWRAALAQADEGTQLLAHGSYTETIGRQLLAATAQARSCTAWLAYDAGHDDAARSCETDALAIGRQLGDARIETRSLTNLALWSSDRSQPVEARNYAHAAEHAVTQLGSGHRLAVLPQFRVALAGAMVGDARAADRAISTARQLFDRLSDAPSGSESAFEDVWWAGITPAELDAIEGRIDTELGQSARAARLLEQSIAGYDPEHGRNVARIQTRLARARLDANEVDGAAEAAHAALDGLAGEITSWRVAAELDTVLDRFAHFRGVDGVNSLLARRASMAT